ncbi:monooxygenase [Nocardiopsis terrae]|uniref:Cation diffusion facilitator CzcD-associated flavoprotein CzcO n=1 Tax=Nocardiopsis terrae TaxID=372655 RepID=A0ABR9HCV2_9ACTN|nr:ArsO family NAD(P)H-dependent flavin-containing monooxygenase [Nocardiopsis terrae]MBE1456842.1 cation diffusion facilitator CzcD-associated flavoprotein CzcO [Nocardiopsis terrae]GHC74835.1 monooxygenase [Nocardiopsis terrae]
MAASADAETDVVVIGGGPAGLATGYHLTREQADYVILDGQGAPGGFWDRAWSNYWDSLRLISPAEHSSLPGWRMPGEPGQELPSARHVADYLAAYERRYGLPVRRPVTVTGVRRADGALEVVGSTGTWRARHVVSATGTWRRPYTPDHPGRHLFEGRQLHTADYRGPEEFAGRRVTVVGGGNSAAQLLADLSEVAHTTWVARRPVRFMPDDVDGRVLFDADTQRALGGRTGRGAASPGDIVMVPSVRRARDRGVLTALPMFERLTRTGVAWADGSERETDAVLWCTGFRPVLDHLAPLEPFDADGRIPLDGNRSVREPRLHLIGYGDWTGAASDTLVGAGRTAGAAVARIVEDLRTG